MDAWGRKFSYYVTTAATTTGGNTGNIHVQDYNVNESSPTVSDATFVIISHGSDGKGAYTTSGSQISYASGVDNDETQNIFSSSNMTNSTTHPFHISAGATGDIAISSRKNDVVNNFVTRDANNNYSNGFTIKRDTGNVGIGTNNPHAKLHVSSNINNDGIIITNSDPTENTIDKTARLVFRGTDGAGNPKEAFIIRPVPNNHNYISSHVDFLIRHNDSLTNALRILSNGNVGIGTDNPQAKLHVKSNIDGDGIIITNTDPTEHTTNKTARLVFRGTDGAGNPKEAFIIRSVPNDHNYVNSHVDFLIRHNDSLTNALRILSNGNIGIGTASPTQKLHVVGNIKATGELNVDSNINFLGNNFFRHNNVTYYNNGNLSLNIGSSSPVHIFRANSIDLMKINTDRTISEISTIYLGSVLNCSQLGSDSGGKVYCPNSDQRLKKNIKSLDNALDKITKLKGISFNWRKDEFPKRSFNDKKQIGVIAQEVEKQFPELVSTDNEGYRSVAYSNLVAPLIEAVKTLKNNQDIQQTEINNLKSLLIEAGIDKNKLEQKASDNIAEIANNPTHQDKQNNFLIKIIYLLIVLNIVLMGFIIFFRKR